MPALANLARWFVLDAYESNGSFPIFYYADITDQKAGSGLNDNDAWDLASTYSIYRYDSGSNTRESLAETGNYPIQMMIYGDSVYIITQGSKKEYQLNLLDKKSKKWTELAIGEDKLELLSANDEFVYVSDLDGHVYQVKSDLQSYDLIYTVEDAYVLSSGEIRWAFSWRAITFISVRTMIPNRCRSMIHSLLSRHTTISDAYR